MDRMIYLSMSGAKAMMQRQEAQASNLANINTPGFRAELQSFRAVPVQGSGASTRVYALETTTGYDASSGVISETGRSLDVAAKGNAWFAVQGLDGTEAYTRYGAFDVNSEGTLVTLNGLQVLGDGGPIQVAPDSEVSIGADGTVSVRSAAGKISSAGKLKLVTPETPLQRGEDGLFRAEAELPADPNAKVVSGSLEGSNVNPVETMISMIAAARQFEAQMKMLQTAEGDEKAATQLLGRD